MEQYKVTGVTVDGKRFRPIMTTNYMHAMGINLWRGTVWVRWTEGERVFWKIVKRVWNV